MGKIRRLAVGVAFVGVCAAIGNEMAKDKNESVAVFNPTITNTADQIARNPNAPIDLSGFTSTKVTLPKQGITKPADLIRDTYNQTGLIGRTADKHIGAAVACAEVTANGKHWPTEALNTYRTALDLAPKSIEADKQFETAEAACLGALAAEMAVATEAQPRTFTVINGLANIG